MTLWLREESDEDEEDPMIRTVRVGRWLRGWAARHPTLVVRTGCVLLAIGLLNYGTKIATLYNDVEGGVICYCAALICLVVCATGEYEIH